MQKNEHPEKMELLAPAGSLEVLESAVSAGADAVYFGLDELNARRGAENISSDKLETAISIAHQKNCKAYLAINIDIAEREIGLAARYLEFACAKSVDAVIVKDPMFFQLIPYFPHMRFHLSTQSAISSSAGVRAAKEFGFSRVVLPRELSKEEILAASSVEGIETEIFVQGALCFCVSGRCLLSSWLGGRSGNRGLCASPCRFLWQYENNSARLLSARDISLAKRIKDIEACGVHALKIEGRLKNKEWVAKTVKLFRKVLDDPEATIEESEFATLGDYAGRTSICSYFDGLRTNITGDSARLSSSCLPNECLNPLSDLKKIKLDIEAQLCNNKIQFKFQYRNRIKEFEIKILSHGKKFKTETDLITEIKSKTSCNIEIGNIVFPDNLRIPNNAFRDFRNELNSFLHQIQKSPDTYLKIQLSTKIREALEKTKGYCPQNNKTLPALPDGVRLASFADFCEFRRFFPETEIILENAEASDINRIQALNIKKPVISLPPVFYECDIEKIISLLEACSRANFEVEVNSWDGWFLAKEANLNLRGGPGLMVLNSVAAYFLGEKGCKNVFASLEADSEKLVNLCCSSKVPICLYAYGKPALMISRARLNIEVPENGLRIKEKKGNIFLVKYEGALLVLRPEEPFDISSENSDNLRVSHFVADLVAEKNPLQVFKDLSKKSKVLPTNSFNFHRALG